MLCRKSASMLTSVKAELDELGFGLVAVGSGTPFMAKVFKQDFAFQGDIYVDQKREVYQALGCNRGAMYCLNKKALKAIKNTYSEGFSQGKTQGDSLQLGGTFIISLTNGILFEHQEQFAGDNVDLVELMNAARQIASGKLNE